MHELSLCLSMLDLIAERVRAEGAHRVLRIGVDIGALGHVEPQALAFCFESAARGTAAAGARLEIRVVPGRAYCFDCGEGMLIRQRGEDRKSGVEGKGGAVRVIPGGRRYH